MKRDVELFLENWFQLKVIQPVDMFPQTHHIETIWVLQ
jgi:23S rRNA (uracil1939-C5)-methyltransferase